MSRTTAILGLVLSGQCAIALAQDQSTGGELARAVSAGDTFQDCDVCPQMVVVPSGRFLMGSPETEEGRDDDEGPQHEVTVPAFAIGVTEVTFDEYDAFARATGRELPRDLGWGRGRRPVVNVSWVDATAYTAWLSAETGKSYRLPSEAEWEYAARAGTQTAYWWGNEVGEDRANCLGCGGEWDGVQAAPVASFAPNPFGLYDTVGNVVEWVEDCWHSNYDRAPDDGSVWSGGDCNYRVLRDGSWRFPPSWSRSADRDREWPVYRDSRFGFRVLRSSPID